MATSIKHIRRVINDTLDERIQSSCEYLSQYTERQQDRILEFVFGHEFLRNYLLDPEILFKPTGEIQPKDGWREKSINEQNEPLVALTGYKRGKFVRIHNRIFPDPAYFKQGIKESLPEVYAREGVAKSLLAYLELLPKNYAIRAYDGYRPIAVQQDLYDKQYAKVKSEQPEWTEEEVVKEVAKFVSVPSRNPKHPSTHNTGGAIDFRICDMRGNELNYGCEFDDFREIANQDYFEKKFQSGKLLTNEELEALLIKRVTANIAIHNGVNLCRYNDEDWHFNHNDQWDSQAPVSKYGSCEMNGIIPDSNYTIADVIKQNVALYLSHGKHLTGGKSAREGMKNNESSISRQRRS